MAGDQSLNSLEEIYVLLTLQHQWALRQLLAAGWRYHSDPDLRRQGVPSTGMIGWLITAGSLGLSLEASIDQRHSAGYQDLGRNNSTYAARATSGSGKCKREWIEYIAATVNLPADEAARLTANFGETSCSQRVRWDVVKKTLPIRRRALVPAAASAHERGGALIGASSAELDSIDVPLASEQDHVWAPSDDGLFEINKWSPNRLLEPSHLRTVHLSSLDRPQQSWIDPATLAAAVEASAHFSGQNLYLAGWQDIDHRESFETQTFVARLAETHYPESMAIGHLRRHRPDALAKSDEQLDLNPNVYVTTAVPSALCVNVVVVTEHAEVLALRRSAAVGTAVGLYTIGPVESMKVEDPNCPGRREDFFSLAWRCLEEELHLTPWDVHALYIAWLGIYRPMLRGHLVAIAPLRVDRQELADRQEIAHSTHEADRLRWLKLNRATVAAFTSAPHSAEPSTDVHPALDFDGVRWVDHSRLALRQAWRYRELIANHY
jgi:hypothetical protein